jgi:hypothetical protein
MDAERVVKIPMDNIPAGRKPSGCRKRWSDLIPD